MGGADLESWVGGADLEIEWVELTWRIGWAGHGLESLVGVADLKSWVGIRTGLEIGWVELTWRLGGRG